MKQKGKRQNRLIAEMNDTTNAFLNAFCVSVWDQNQDSTNIIIRILYYLKHKVVDKIKNSLKEYFDTKLA